MAKYVIDSTTLTGIADGVRKVTGTSAKMNPSEMASALKNVEVSGGGYDEGYTDGKQAEYDRFWDEYLNNGNITDLTNAFASSGWNEKTFFPKYNIFAGCKLNYTFRYSAFAGDFVQRMIDLGFGDICFAQTNPAQTFRDMPNVTRLPVVRPTENHFLGSLNYFYTNDEALETIDRVLATCPNWNANITFAGTFDGCTSLKNIRFEGLISNDISFKDSGLLSDESVQDIIDHLTDLTGGTTKTLTLNSAITESMPAEQAQEIWDKNWTLE